jgi:hypothetical protein
MAPMEYSGAWGTLIHEKNLKSKISCQTPFKSQRKSFRCIYFFECRLYQELFWKRRNMYTINGRQTIYLCPANAVLPSAPASNVL